MGRKLIDWTNKEFQGCIILRPTNEGMRKSIDYWYVKCHCGKQFVTTPVILQKKTNTKSCGCLRSEYLKENGNKHKSNNYNNTIINDLLIIEPKNLLKNTCQDYFRIKCHCGKIFEAFLTNVQTNKTKSCGCTKNNFIKNFNEQNRIDHGLNKDEFLTDNISFIRNFIFSPIKQLILEIDNYTCALCGNRESGCFEIHHIDPLNNFDFSNLESYLKIYDLKNLITLCKNCHMPIAHNGHGTRINSNIQKELFNLTELRFVNKILLDKYNSIVEKEIKSNVTKIYERITKCA